MPVSLFIKLVEDDRDYIVQVRWRGLPNWEDTLESLHQVFKGVPQMLSCLLEHKATPTDLEDKLYMLLFLQKGSIIYRAWLHGT